MRRFLTGALTLCLLCGCGGTQNRPMTATGYLLDTVVSVTIYRGGTADLLDETLALCAEYEHLLSRTDPASEIYRLNRAGGEAVRVSQDTRAVIALALEYAALSHGKFDITICPVVDLWDFRAVEPALPDPEALAGALAAVGWEAVEISGDTVRLHGGAQIDLGGIAKGYIADRMGEFLRENGVDSATVNLGGNVVAVGGRPSGEDFRIGVQKPFGHGNETVGTVRVRDRTVVSSGVYERSFVLDGDLYHHILDPDTGYPARTGLSAVTVICGQSADADALTTAAFLLGLEDGLALLESVAGTEALFIDDGGEMHFTSGFVAEYEYTPA